MKHFCCSFASSVVVFVLFLGVGYSSFGGFTNRQLEIRRRTEVLHNLASYRHLPRDLQQIAFRRILMNNLRVDAVILLGTITFGLVGVTVIVVNGFKIGYQYHEADASGIKTRLYCSAILPHGVLEYLAYLFAETAALEGARMLWFYSRSTKPRPQRWILPCALLSVLLIAVGAWVEVFVTPEVYTRWGAG